MKGSNSKTKYFWVIITVVCFIVIITLISLGMVKYLFGKILLAFSCAFFVSSGLKVATKIFGKEESK